MLLQRFYDDALAQASYLIGCQATGEALVLDPNRDVDQYVRAAQREQLRITRVTETHIHADFVSGARELATRTGATLLLSDEGGDEWRYRFAGDAGTTLLHGGDAFTLGNIRFSVLHTPGHTPEHLTFVVTDGAATDKPMGAFTGDFIFVGDVGRPDLLERAAHYAGTMEASARALFQSLRRFRALPDYLQLWPGHGAGSACGKSLGAVPSTTLGYEKIASWAFGIDDEAEFVRQVLAGQPEPPRYFAVMKALNRNGPPARPNDAVPTMSVADVQRALRAGTPVIDTRATAEFAKGFIPGAMNLPLNKSFTNWAGSLLPFDRDLVLIANDEASARQAARQLSLIGLDRVSGWVSLRIFEEWREVDARPLSTIPQVDPAEAAARPDTQIIDVRAESEWDAGHIPGAVHHFLGRLVEETKSLPRDMPLVMQCQGGGRSAIAASLLRANGFTNVSNLRGGISAWRAAGFPVDTEESEVPR
jgi:hydroxyacylglutathione hydrolase